MNVGQWLTAKIAGMPSTAKFAVTIDPFIVLDSNLFAILGLRAMYFPAGGVAAARCSNMAWR